MKGRDRILTLALAGVLSLSSCAAPSSSPAPSAKPASSQPVREEERLDFILPCYPAAGFHPITGNNRLNLTFAPLVYRGLFSVDTHFQAQPDLCESYIVSEDALTWTFRLTGAVFSDGSPLTSKEVVSSLDTARQSERYAGRLTDIESIGAEGETVVVTLREPNGGLPLLLDIPIVKEGEDPQRPLGTGPYVLTEEETGLTLTARQGAQVPLPVIPLRTVMAGDDLVYAFDAREISLVDTDLTGTNALGYSGRLETTDYFTTTLLYIGCNLTSGPCKSQKVRQAVALAVDRKEIAERILAGHGVPSPLPVHPTALGYDAELAQQWGQDLERAETLLNEDGWSVNEEGKLTRQRGSLTLRLIVNQDNTFKAAAAEEVAAALEKLGCEVALEKLSWEDFMEALKKGEFDLYMGETALSADFDLRSLLGPGGALNYTGFSDRETWELMDQYRKALGEERETTLVNLCGRMAETAPIVSLCFKNGSLLTQWGQVAGAAPTQRDVFAGIKNWTVRHS